MTRTGLCVKSPRAGDRSWRVIKSVATAGAVFAGLALTTPAAAAPSEICETAALQAMAPADTTIGFAAREFGGGCRVQGYVTTNDPTPNRVLFVLALPDNFNGRYVYLGVGGSAGSLPYVPADLYRRGYVIAGSDGGSGAKTIADFSFRSDPAKATDFAWRGVHVSAQATQAIMAVYYKRKAAGRYITGCSGGGAMGMTSVMRFGRGDFDGFIVGGTAIPGTAFMANLFRVEQYINNHPDGWISPELARKADAAIMERYDDVDGARDGVIADARSIKDFDVGILRNVGFTPAQIAEFNVIRTAAPVPVKELSGKLVPGLPIANVMGWTHYPLGTKSPPWPSAGDTSPGQILASGASFYHVMLDTMVRSRHPQTYYADVRNPETLARFGLEDNFQGSLDNAAASGAKVIIYHGVNDEAMSYLDALDGYEALAKKYPNSRDWVRFFPVAGLMHCRAGIGPSDAPEQLLEAMADWVENGKAPETVVAHRRAIPYNWIEQGRTETIVADDRARDWERQFRLCAEPNRVALKGAGLDPKLADNWTCRAP